MTTTVPFHHPTRNIFHNGFLVGRVSRVWEGGKFVYVPHLTEDPPLRTDPNRVVCDTWTEARNLILGIYR